MFAYTRMKAIVTVSPDTGRQLLVCQTGALAPSCELHVLIHCQLYIGCVDNQPEWIHQCMHWQCLGGASVSCLTGCKATEKFWCCRQLFVYGGKNSYNPAAEG